MTKYGGYEVNFVPPQHLVPPTEWELCLTRQEVRSAGVVEWVQHVKAVKGYIDRFVERSKQVVQRPSSGLVEYAKRTQRLRKQFAEDVGKATLINMGFKMAEPAEQPEPAQPTEPTLPLFTMSEELEAGSEAILGCGLCKSGTRPSPENCGNDILAVRRAFLAKQLGISYAPPALPPADATS